MSRDVTLVVALIMSAAAAPAWCWPIGRPQVHVTQVRVPIGDLDLNSQAGADTLIRRVSAAAAHACGIPEAVGVTRAEELRAYRACKAKALAKAVAQVDRPAVQARYAQVAGANVVKVAQGRP
jgi:UrcA family protein